MYKEKYLKYKKKYLRLKKLIGGSFSNMPNEITIDEYNYLPSSQKKIYIHMQLGNHIYYSKNAKLIRQEQIKNDPYAIINVSEFNNLPRDKYGFHWIANYQGGNFPISYHKGEKIIYDSVLPHRNESSDYSRPSSNQSYSRPSSNSESKLKRLNNRLALIMSDPNIKISPEEYQNLPSNAFVFQWSFVTNGNYYIKKRLFDIMYDPTVKISKEEYYNLPPGGYGYKWLLVRDYNRNIIYYVKR